MDDRQKQYNRNYKVARKAKFKVMALDLLGGKCVKCSSTDRLEFDHINDDRQGGIKGQVSHMLANRSWESIKAELKKCQLLCKPCHQRKSLSARGYRVDVIHGTFTMYNKRGCRCDECRNAATIRARYYRANKLKRDRIMI